MPATEPRLQAAFDAIDARNGQDPNRETTAEGPQPKELLYGRRMSDSLARFAPAASEALQLAARAQHIERWRIPRGDYPKTRPGYLQWRRDLGRFHADTCAHLLEEVGYEAATIERVRSLLMKRNLRQDAEAQTLEDVACLVFLQYYLADFAAGQPKDKVVAIIRKTWNKMSAAGQAAALELDLVPTAKVLVDRALTTG